MSGMMLPVLAFAQPAPAVSADSPAKSLGVVTVNSGQPTSLPTQIPTTIEGVTKEQIEQTINATDSEDALKYFPSLLVRKRYIGDYNHAILSSRASGTGNSARSMVYADGILLSNYLATALPTAPTTRRAGAWSRPRKSSVWMFCTGLFLRLTLAIRSVRWWITSRACRQNSSTRQTQRFYTKLQALRHRQQLWRQPGQRVTGQQKR